MKLFKYEGYQIVISEEALLLQPFKKLWKRDTTKGKPNALAELGFIYFMEDPRSDYQTYIDREERAKQIKIGEGLRPNWKPDEMVLEAMEFYASFKSEAAILLEDTRDYVKKLRDQLKTINLDAKDGKGRPLYTLSAYTDTVTKLSKLVTTLDEAEKSISREATVNDKVRGAAQKNMYEDIV